MSRTPGSGWGAGPMLWQVCPFCGKKKCYYDPIPDAEYHKPFRCTACKERNYSDKLIRSATPLLGQGTEREISVRAEYMFQFTSQSHWVNKAKTRFANSGVPHDEHICIDTAGNVLVCGKDFMEAERHNRYPVKVYRLIRTTEAVSPKAPTE